MHINSVLSLIQGSSNDSLMIQVQYQNQIHMQFQIQL